MDVTYYNRKSNKDDMISFPLLQCWNPVSKIITIAAQVSGKRVLCNIATNDLKTKYHVFEDEPMKIVTDHRAEIETAAKKLIEAKSFEKDGSIKIGYKDL
jgi:hypothetical protein